MNYIKGPYLQYGKGLNYIHGPYLQHGKGFGSVLSRIFRAVIPAVKSIGKSVFKSSAAKSIGKDLKDVAISSGMNLAADIIRGKNVKEAASDTISHAKKQIADSIQNASDNRDKLIAKKRRKERPVYKTVKKVKKLKKSADIFS